MSYVDMRLWQHAQTDDAIKVSDTGDDVDAVWLPKGEIEFEEDPADRDYVDVTMPEWLAMNEGLI